MEASKLRRNSTQKVIQGPAIKKIKRVHHIKSLPNQAQESARKSILQQNQTHLNLDQNQVKLKRFKTQQNLKPAHFGAVKTARERTLEWGRRKWQPSQQNKSLTKSTTYRSPQDENEKRKSGKGSKQKSKKSARKMYANIFIRVKQVIQQYQLKLERFQQQKQQISKENLRLKSQLQSMNKRMKKKDL